jgi:hypothetical protein
MEQVDGPGDLRDIAEVGRWVLGLGLMRWVGPTSVGRDSRRNGRGTHPQMTQKDADEEEGEKID